jgi:hypothetical protein
VAAPKTLTPEDRALRARIAAHAQHAQGRTNTAPGRAEIDRRYEDEVDPDRTLSPEERAKRVKHARTSHMLSLSLKSAQARARRKKAS